jgi:hypothetical protein
MSDRLALARAIAVRGSTITMAARFHKTLLLATHIWCRIVLGVLHDGGERSFHNLGASQYGKHIWGGFQSSK